MLKENRHVCTICQAPYSEEEGGLEGELGIIPVQFCPFCLAGLFDMVEQMHEESQEPGCEVHQPA
jgi:hypothetical protein